MKHGRSTLGAVAVVAVAMVLGGCGSEETPATDATGPVVADSTPQPAAPISDGVERLDRALASGECTDEVAVFHPALLEEPADPDSPDNCKSVAFRIKALEGFESSETQEFGPAALVDGKINGDPVTLPWVLDETGDYRWISTSVPTNEIGTEPAAGADIDGPAVALVDALRAGDCDAAYAQIGRGTRLDYGDERSFCEAFNDTFTGAPETFGARLDADPQAAPVELGATRNVAFYGVATEPAGYRVIVVAYVEDEPKVFDVVPVER